MSIVKKLVIINQKGCNKKKTDLNVQKEANINMDANTQTKTEVQDQNSNNHFFIIFKSFALVWYWSKILTCCNWWHTIGCSNFYEYPIWSCVTFNDLSFRSILYALIFLMFSNFLWISLILVRNINKLQSVTNHWILKFLWISNLIRCHF